MRTNFIIYKNFRQELKSNENTKRKKKTELWEKEAMFITKSLVQNYEKLVYET